MEEIIDDERGVFRYLENYVPREFAAERSQGTLLHTLGALLNRLVLYADYFGPAGLSSEYLELASQYYREYNHTKNPYSKLGEEASISAEQYFLEAKLIFSIMNSEIDPQLAEAVFKLANRQQGTHIKLNEKGKSWQILTSAFLAWISGNWTERLEVSPIRTIDLLVQSIADVISDPNETTLKSYLDAYTEARVDLVRADMMGIVHAYFYFKNSNKTFTKYELAAWILEST